MSAHGAGDDAHRAAILGPTLLQVQCGTCNKMINVHPVHIGPLMANKSYTCPNCHSLQSIDIEPDSERILTIQAQHHLRSMHAAQQLARTQASHAGLPPQVAALLQQHHLRQQQQLQQQIARTGAAGFAAPGRSYGSSRNYNHNAAAAALPAPPPAVEEEPKDMLLEEELAAAGGDEVEDRKIFVPYKPSKLDYGDPHPDAVVETASLQAVEPPEITYIPVTKEHMIKCLSNLQIEAIVYASQRHEQILPNGARGGFFIGDGAGVGKGRTIAGLMLENWRQGRKKHLWVSVGSDLKVDAERDLNDVGAGPNDGKEGIPLHALNKLPYGKLAGHKIGVKEGIVFLTYSSLVSASERGMSRYKQLVEWCGKDFDGLIVFDESHKAKNLVAEAGSKPTQVGLRVKEIQEALPQARVVYCSATGASEPRNMGYMVRLGLWGEGHPAFRDFSRFLEAIQGKGSGGAAAEANTMAALELVAMDMKAQGMYLCRTLSFDGAEFQTVDAELEEPIASQYYAAAEMWNRLFREFLFAEEKAAEAEESLALVGRNIGGGGAVEDGTADSGTAGNGGGKDSAAVSGATAAGTTTRGGNRRGGFGGGTMTWRAFWAGHQRFFRHMCMAAKVPKIVSMSLEALAEGKCVVIGLQSTGAARTEDVKERAGGSLELEDFVSGPKELLMQLVDKNYPLPPDPYAEDWDADTDSDGDDEEADDFENQRISEAVARGGLAGREFSKRSKSDVRYKEYASDEDIGMSEDENRSVSSSSSESSSSDSESEGEEKEEEGKKKKGVDGKTGSASNSAKSGDGAPAPSGSVVVVEGSDEGSDDGDSESSGVESDSSFDADDELQRQRRRLARRGLTEEQIKEKEMETEIRRMRREHAAEAFRAAVARKKEVQEAVAKMQLPSNPLDELIDQLGGPGVVAEMTGRKGRYLRDKNSATGGVRYESRNASGVDKSATLEMINVHERQLFMDDVKLVAIISEAASAGISLHADVRAKNTRRRVHITLELPWSADKATQQFGRSHRANQAHGPQYRLVFTKLGGEKRFAAAVARRLESLGALSQGDRGSAGVSLSAFNYESTWGQRALKEMYGVFLGERPPAIVPVPCRPGPNGEPPKQPLSRFLGKARAHLLNAGLLRHNRAKVSSMHINDFLSSPEGAPRGVGTIDDRERNDVPRFLNRLLGLDPQAQADIFDYYQETLDEEIARAKREDTLDSGIVELTGRSCTIEGEPKTLYTDPTTGTTAVLYSIKIDRGLPWEDAKTLLDERLADEAAAAEVNVEGTPGKKEPAAAEPELEQPAEPEQSAKVAADGVAMEEQKETGGGGIKRPREEEKEELDIDGDVPNKVEDVDAVSEQPEKKLKVDTTSEDGKIEEANVSEGGAGADPAIIQKAAAAAAAAVAAAATAAPVEDIIDLVSEDERDTQPAEAKKENGGGGDEIDQKKTPKPSEGGGKEEAILGSGFYKGRQKVIRGRVHIILALQIAGSSPPSFILYFPSKGKAKGKPMPLKELQTKFSPLSIDDAAPLWQTVYTTAGEPTKDAKEGRIRSLHVLCGRVMQCYAAVQRALVRHVKSSERRMKVNGILTTGENPQRLVGMIVPEAAVEDVVKELMSGGVQAGLASVAGPPAVGE